LFQKYFKSIGPRTYAVQIKEASNGNHFIVLTEGKRDLVTNEVRKNRLFIYSEDFGAYFRMLHETAQFIKTHPVPEHIKARRQRYWAKKEAEAATAAREAAERQAAAAAAKPIRPQKVAATKSSPPRKPARGR
jgi:topoisomerase IA-like protein